MLAALGVLAGFVFIFGVIKMQPGSGGKTDITDYHEALFGENVYVFSPEDDPAEVKQILEELYDRQETNQFGDERYAIYFMPGEYDEAIQPEVGFYTQVSGLGILPTDTKIQGLSCLARWLGDDEKHGYGIYVPKLQTNSYGTTWLNLEASDALWTDKNDGDASSDVIVGIDAFYVDDAAEDFFATGLGIYLYNRDAEVNLYTAVEMPDKEGVRIENICTVMLTGYPGMEHVVNDSGEGVFFAGARQVLQQRNRCGQSQRRQIPICMTHRAAVTA